MEHIVVEILSVLLGFALVIFLLRMGPKQKQSEAKGQTPSPRSSQDLTLVDLHPPLMAKLSPQFLKMNPRDSETHSRVVFLVRRITVHPESGVLAHVDVIQGNFNLGTTINLVWLSFFPSHLKGLEIYDLA
jgi:hypothetical protein